MSFVLVVEPRDRSAQRIEEALASGGWQTRRVTDPSEALRLAAAEAPKLVVASGEQAAAAELVAAFARRRGGPGAVVLVSGEGGDPRVRAAADEVLSHSFTPAELTSAVRRCLAAERSAKPPRGVADASRFSSREIFGDVLAELDVADDSPPREEPPREGPPAGEPERGAADVERRLEETLSGFREERRRERARPSAPPATDEVDALLDRTLADLQLGRRRKGGTAAGQPAAPGGPPAAPGRDPEAGDDRDFGQYTLEERIAVGGMAEVWKARMKGFEGFQKTVAIKRILPHLTGSEDFVTMFIDEAKLAAQLNHNNIIQIYDLGKIDDDYYIAMEYVAGKDLRAILAAARRRGGTMPLGLSLLIAARLADALHYAHRKRDFDDRDLGLVHRDVSPQNVLISTEGEIKLCDFGIAKAVSKVSETQMGALKGKLRYMSPEQAWGRSVDARSDIFSLGSLTFEMLTGEPLFAGETEVAVLEAVRECRPRDARAVAPEVPERVVEILDRALAKEPRERFETAGAMHEELAEVLLSLDETPSRVDLGRYVSELFEGRIEPAEDEEAPAAPPVPTDARPPAPEPRAPSPLAAEPPPGEAGPAAAPPEERPQGPAAAETGTDPGTGVAGGEPEQEEAPAVEEVEALHPVGDLEESERGDRRRWMVIGVVAAAVVLAVGGWLYYSSQVAPPPTGAAGRETRAPAAELGGAELPPVVPEEVVAGDGGEALGVDPGAESPEGEATAGDAAPGGGEGAGQGGEPPAQPLAAPAEPPPPVDTAEERPDPLPEQPAEQPAEQRPDRRPEAGRQPPAERPAERPAEEPAATPPATAPEEGEPTPAAGRGAAADAAATPAGGEGEAPTGREVPGEVAETAVAAEPGSATAPEEGAGGAGPGGDTAAETGAESSPAGAPDDEGGLEGGAAERAEEAPAEPQVEVGELVEIGPGVVPPDLVSFEKPEYPPVARRLRVQGTVVVNVLVDENGAPIEWELVRSVNPRVGINEAVVEAVERARWNPATKHGVPVKMWTTVVVPFKM